MQLDDTDVLRLEDDIRLMPFRIVSTGSYVVTDGPDAGLGKTVTVMTTANVKPVRLLTSD